MISVMNEREIDRNPVSTADLSFFGMENPQEGARVFGGEAGSMGSRGLEEARVSSALVSRVQGRDLDARVSEDGQQDRFRSPDYASGEVEMNADEVGVAESNPWRGGSAMVDAGDENLVSSPEEIRVSREPSGNWMHGFKTGDLVWGKVKSHPWWPGHIFNESFASPSVRRTRREGHVLVAFFGDSSYGWFEPAELIPFDPHFPEKSRQTTARTFVKAVEEAVDEASRRAALGLACCCRNPNNFRPTTVPGCFAVDVVGYEPSGLYSSQQIKKARDSFVPTEALSFVNQLAVMPHATETKSIDWIRSMAMMLAYRKAVFEEFDETYAQAFGIQPVRPTQNNLGVSDQPDRFAARAAPLSGPLVIAETLGHKKSSSFSSSSVKSAAKPPKISSSASAKKNKYVLKRRDELPATISSLPDLPSISQPQPQPQRTNTHDYLNLPSSQQQPNSAHHTPSSSSSSSQAANYVLQKREDIKADDGSSLERRMPHLSMSQPPVIGAGGSHSASVASDDWKPKNEQPMVAPLPPPVGTMQGLESNEYKPAKLDSKDAFAFDSAQPKHDGYEQKAREGKVVNGAVKKEKVKKRPREEHPDRPDDKWEVKKKKKKKKKDGFGLDYPPIPSSGEPQKKASHPELARPDVPSIPSIPQPALDLGSVELELPQILSDLSEVALDPFHGIERNAPSVVRQVFLKFRSLVYQKSLVSEGDTQELRDGKPEKKDSVPVVGQETREPREAASKPKPLKPVSVKSSLRPDDPTKAGRKRPPSDRQEEISAKRLKKLNKVKSLASEKKAGISQKTSEGQQQQKDLKDSGTTLKTASAPSKPSTSEPVKKQEPLLPLPPKKESPTYMIMYFPPRSTLPSIANLKARFARFGPLDHSSTRVYWKSYSCKVLFKYKSDAQAAINYVKNNSIFGQSQLNCHLRDHESSAGAAEPSSEPGKRRPDPQPSGNGGASIVMTLTRSSSFQQRQQQQQPGQLKSILKKPSDEVGPNGAGAGRENQRVKFLLSGEDGKAEPPPPVDGGSLSDGTPVPSLPPPPPFEPVTRTLRSVSFLPPPPPLPHSIPSHSSGPYHSHVLETHHLPPPPPLPSLAPQLQSPFPPPPPLRVADVYESRGPAAQSSEGYPRHNAQQYGEVEGRNKSNVDISHQLLNLLLRCNDIVASVRSLPGYVPYRPL